MLERMGRNDEAVVEITDDADAVYVAVNLHGVSLTLPQARVAIRAMKEALREAEKVASVK